MNQGNKVEEWFKLIQSETLKKYRFKNDQISNRVNLRGIDKHHESNASTFRIVYNQYFDLVGLKTIKSYWSVSILSSFINYFMFK